MLDKPQPKKPADLSGEWNVHILAAQHICLGRFDVSECQDRVEHASDPRFEVN